MILQEPFNENMSPVRADDLNAEGVCFGLRYTTGGGPEGLVELYIEDDENWFFKCKFNHLWLKDLRNQIDKAIKDFGLD
jgi:hypothetical protein